MVLDLRIWIVASIWLCTIAAGFWLMERYDTTPGLVDANPVAPEEQPRDRWQLTFFAHPRCPCLRTTLHELDELARTAPALSVRILFVRPPGAGDGWERSDFWEKAAKISGAEVGCDVDGIEARRLGAATSGLAVLMDLNGHVVFRGGLTNARGRAGESTGRRAILTWLESGNGVPTTPVFGCPLFSDS